MQKTARRPLKYYLSLQYPITLNPSVDGGYVVEIEDLPGCMSQGETVKEAVEMINEARQLWLESAYEDGQDIPLPRGVDEYSGKFIVRFPRTLPRKLDQMADREGVSLNQFLVPTLSHAVGLKEGKTK